MREILFRGQTRRKGEKVWMDGSPVESNWVYGGLFQGLNRSVIYGYDPIEKYVVYSDTVGQFTGLTDKNGKKIFEGDVIRVGGDIYACRWDQGNVEFGVSNQRESFGIAYAAYPCMEVIGNIHDNPELLGGTGND